MASGKNHDKSIWFCTPIIGAATAYSIGWDAALTVSVSHLLMGLYGSPDLDLKSRPFLRWGHLKVLWKPYQRLVPRHRHWLSHAPLIGTVGRLLYFFGLIVLGYATAISFYGISTQMESFELEAHLQTVSALLGRIPERYLFWSFIGAELSAWNHIVLDGWLLPLPKSIRNALK